MDAESGFRESAPLQIHLRGNQLRAFAVNRDRTIEPSGQMSQDFRRLQLNEYVLATLQIHLRTVGTVEVTDLAGSTCLVSLSEIIRSQGSTYVRTT